MKAATVLMLLAAAWLLFPCACLASNGTIKVLAIGQVLPSECPVSMWFNDEPAIAYTLVLTKGEFVGVSLEDKRKSVRLYMPRTMEKLAAYHFLLFVDTYIDVFTSDQLSMMARGVEDFGLGAFQSMGGKVLSDSGTYNQWANSDLSKVLPYDFSASAWRGGGAFTVRINEDPVLPPVLRMFQPLGIEKVPGESYGRLHPKQSGSVKIWGWLKTDQFKEDPIWMMSWTYGKGEAWSIADDLDHLWWSSVMHGPTQNRYSREVMCNIVFYSAGRPLPEDISLVYKLRQEFRTYAQTRSFLQSLIDLLEGFGANMIKVQTRLREVDSVFDDARSKYVNQDFEGAEEEMSRAGDLIGDIMEESGKIQRRALFWVYVVEWLSVSGTFMVCGVILYMLMVRRRMYKEVAVTRSV